MLELPMRNLHTQSPQCRVAFRAALLHQLLQRRQRPAQGFSLLEMVVVLAVIGILISIQLPNILGNTDKARFVGAQARLTAAISECITARNNGVPETELRVSRGSRFYELVPSLEQAPEGFTWQFGTSGCYRMRLTPVNQDGVKAVRDGVALTTAMRAVNQGIPILQAMMLPGGRVVKIADACRRVGSLDFTADCAQWDPTINRQTWRSGRNITNGCRLDDFTCLGTPPPEEGASTGDPSV